MSFIDKYKEQFKQRMETKRKEDKIVAHIREQERFKQKMETARYQEKQRGAKRRKFINQGGAYGQFMKIAKMKIAKDVSKQPAPKKGKKGKKKQTTEYRKPYQPPKMNIMDIDLGL